MNKLRRFLIEKFHFVAFALIFVVYNLTTAPSVIQIDSGELATIQILPGVAHPTGYPLFTFLGYIISNIFPVSHPIFLLNKLAMIYVFVSLIVFYKISIILLDKLNKGENNKNVIASFSTLLLAFSFTYWSQSTSVEVYSLHLFLSLLVIYLLLIAYFNNKLIYWIIFATAFALSFGNHMTTVMLLPAIAFIYFRKNGFAKKAFLKIGVMLIVFIPIFIAEYSSLIFLAKTNPKLNWGNVENIGNLFAHLSGRQYRVWMFSGIAVAEKQLIYFISNLANEFAYAALLPILIGIIYMKNRSKDLFYFTSILSLSVIFYAINYDIHDIDSYFLLSYVSFGFFSIFGFTAISSYLTKNKMQIFTIPIFLIIILFEIFFSFANVSQSENYVFEDYTKEALNSLENNALVLTYQWDYFVSPSYYYRYVENYRNDVAVIDKELLRRSWYYKQLRFNYPFVFKGLEKTVEKFLIELKPFESGQKYNSAMLEKLYRNIISQIISQNVKKRAVYIAPELIDNELKRGEFSLPKGYTLFPCNFFYKVVPANKTYSPKFTPVKVRFTNAPKNRYVLQVQHFLKTMLVRRALYEMSRNENEKAKEILRNYMSEFPGSGIPTIFNKLFKEK